MDQAAIHLCFAWQVKPDQWHVERVPILDSLTAGLREVAKNAAGNLHDNRAELAYDPEYPLNETQFFAIPNPRTVGEATPVGGDLFPQLDNFGQLPSYADTRRRTSPNLYVIVAQAPDGSLAMFGRRVKPSSLLKSSRLLRTLFKNGTLDLIDDGPVLALEPFIDWIDWHSTVLVLDAGGFHGAFRTIEALRTAVAGHVETLSTKLAIDNLDGFIERCQKTPPMASKLASVIEQGHYEKPIEVLREYSDRYPELGVEWNGDALVFDGSLEKQWSILRLLDEAGFTGELSGEKFEAPAKRHL
ncbi:MAG: DUF4868 domain-containing protein [Actinobacteria bacterium]|nr:DUF4868 domain-containing protein [Actinomycetota bacterium]